MPDVLIVGAGLAGLACACELTQKGLSCVVVEAADDVGGRVRTDEVDGFLLDRGFQILLTAYPEAQRFLDYSALNLRSFEPGAMIRFHDKFHRVADPWRRPAAALSTLFSPVGTFADKLRLGRLRNRLLNNQPDAIERGAETTTLQFLRDYGFSPRMIERFFRPFLGGVFLERDLQTSSRMFEFVFRMFSVGDASLPAQGMGAIARQLARRLPPDAIRLHHKVVKLASNVATLSTGEQIIGELRARAVVVATSQSAAAHLLPEIKPVPSRGTTCLYFAAEKSPITEPILVLNAEPADRTPGPVNNFCVPSLVAPSYAPGGAHLISATVIGIPTQDDGQLESSVREQMKAWFGEQVRHWRHLRTYRIPEALPAHASNASDNGKHNQLRSGIFICGDHRDTASINGALYSGRSTAEDVLNMF